jgi:hypothetical protein
MSENDSSLESKLTGLSLGKGSPPTASKSTNNSSSLTHQQQPRRSSSSSTNSDSSKEVQLPQSFVVKYLGKRDASGLWGIQHTREPVDEMVAAAKSLKKGSTLPLLSLEVSVKGVRIEEKQGNLNKDFEAGFHSIREISYGVQDLVYTR